MNDNIYAPPKAENLKTRTQPKKPSIILLILSILLVLINGYFTLGLMDVRYTSSSYYSAYVAGQLSWVFVVPVVVVGLFQIGAKFRSNASRVKIFFWRSVVFLVFKFGSLLSTISSLDH